MRVLIPLLIALLALAPLAAAQEKNETPSDPSAPGERPDDAAWVEDCPPDMMCAYGDEPQAYGPDDCIECSQPPRDEPVRGPADGSCEDCRGENDGATCMDGADEAEICDREVQYLDGGNGQPPIDAEERAADAKNVPAAGSVFVGGAMALAVFLLARRGA